MMAKGNRSPVEHIDDGEKLKFPLKRFEVVFHKFSQVAIPLHLDLLNKHKDNIMKFQRLKEWDRVHREQVNASRTVQQLMADLWEMDRVRQQVRTEDLPEFDRRIKPLKTRAVEAIQDFLKEHQEVAKPQALLLRNAQNSGRCTNNEDPDDELFKPEETKDKQQMIQENCNDVYHSEEEADKALETTKTVANSWRSLYSDLCALNKLIHGFAEAVHSQQPMVDQIEDNIEESAANVSAGSRYLGKSVKLKTAMLPVAGALIGCLAGPVGLIVGLKVGAAAAVGGGVLGYAGGRYLKKRGESITDVEMQELSQKTSSSLPDLSTGNKDLATSDLLKKY